MTFGIVCMPAGSTAEPEPIGSGLVPERLAACVNITKGQS